MVALFDRPAVRCLLVVFSLVFVFFLVLPGGGFYEPFWWASISLIPAVVCAGGWIERIAGAGRRAAIVFGLSGVAIAGLGLATAYTLENQGPYEPWASVQDFADDFLARGRGAFRAGPVAGGPKPLHLRVEYRRAAGGRAYCGLAQIAAKTPPA